MTNSNNFTSNKSSRVINLRSDSAKETEKIGRLLGARLKGGEIIELIGDVGAGKTSFVRGVVEGSGSQDRVSSPTFAIYKVYKAPDFEIYHYDFYRIDDFETVQNELAEIIQESPETVILLEWAESIDFALPALRIKIDIEVLSEESRNLKITIPEQLAQLKYKYSHLNLDELNDELKKDEAKINDTSA